MKGTGVLGKVRKAGALIQQFSPSGVLFSSVQDLSHVRLFVTPWTTARQASLSINNSQSLLKLMSIESVMPSNPLILFRPLLLLPSIFPTRLSHGAVPLPPLYESILGLKVEAVQGKLVSRQITIPG